jgi:predicted MFS family arabinose efflux permease
MVLGFAYAYFLSYGFRVVNAVAGPVLLAELRLPAASLGLLTSVYFLTFGLLQLPAGVLLDRFGPRRVEATLLLLAALGAAVFARAESAAGLALGRGLIGAGVAVCFMASLKAFAVYFPSERQAQLGALMLTAGTTGALVMSAPIAAVLGAVGWRGTFDGLALATLLAAVVVRICVPGAPAGLERAPPSEQLRALGRIVRDPMFRRLAPLAITQHGGFMAVQGLWAGLFLTEAVGLSRAAAASRLLALNAAALVAYLGLAIFGSRLARQAFAIFCAGLAVAQLALGLLLVPGLGGTTALWATVAATGAVTSLSYSLLTARFPPEFAGRAVTALNLAIFAGGFLVQAGLGVAVDLAARAGLDRPSRYRVAFAALLALQLASLLFALGRRERATPGPG